MKKIASIWQKKPGNIIPRLEAAIEKGARLIPEGKRISLFFRADDMGDLSPEFSNLVEIFIKHEIPLCLAVVPAWLTHEKWFEIKSVCKNGRNLWCWHQHGWAHKNHEISGKKQEFGPNRTADDIKKDIRNGKERLISIIKNEFYPVFTPPWNRLSENAIKILADLGFKAISRNKNASPLSDGILPDIQVNVDLHTRKEIDWEKGWNNLLNEIETGLSDGTCGIMIHHQMMNKAAFSFLDIFIEKLKKSKKINFVNFRDLPEYMI